MVSYVLLISIALSLSIGVYIWLKSYSNITPINDCMEGTSIVLEDYSCSGGTIDLTLGNNGLFSIDGIIVQASNDEDKEPTTLLPPVDGFPMGHYYFRESIERIKEIPSSKIISKYGFDGNTRDSKSGNDGEFCDGADCTASPTYVEGIVGDGIRFDGNDLIKIADDDTLDFGVDEDFSISGWLKLEGVFTGGHVLSKGDFDDNDLPGYWITVNPDGTGSIGVHDDNFIPNPYLAINYYPANTIPKDDEWHHITVIFDRDTEIKTYVDGLEIATSSTNGDISTLTGSISNNFDLVIGGYSGASPGYFTNGDIDDIIIFKKALDEDEVKGLFYSGKQLGPNDDETVQFFKGAGDIKAIKIQPFIWNEKRGRIVCSEASLKQEIVGCS